MQSRLRIAALAVLVAGLALALFAYFSADDETANAAMDAMLGSKLYARQLQQFGGKASVLFDEFTRWFDSLWHDKALGVTIGVLSVLASGALFLASRRED